MLRRNEIRITVVKRGLRGGMEGVPTPPQQQPLPPLLRGDTVAVRSHLVISVREIQHK